MPVLRLVTIEISESTSQRPRRSRSIPPMVWSMIRKRGLALPKDRPVKPDFDVWVSNVSIGAARGSRKLYVKPHLSLEILADVSHNPPSSTSASPFSAYRSRRMGTSRGR